MVDLFTTNGRAAREFRHRAGIDMIGINIGFHDDARVVISRW